MSRPVGSLTPEHRIGDWLDITPEGFVSVRSGKAELGQGIGSALVSIVATELGIPVDRVCCLAPSTSSPDEGVTAGSLSMTMSGTAVRLAARALRQVTATPDGASVNLIDVMPWHRDARVLEVLDSPDAADGGPNEIESVVGRAMPRREAPRVDLVAKVIGEPSFVHDLRLPDQMFARVIRRAGWRPRESSIEALDVHAVALPDAVMVVHDGSFLGVIARTEHAAIVAAARVDASVEWVRATAVVDEAVMSVDPLPVAAAVRPDVTGPTITRSHRVRVSRPRLLHASIGPACAVARWDAAGSSLEVWTHSQAVHPLRRELARALGIDGQAVHVTHVPGAGCYGHNGADDVAYDAVLLARRVPGIPVHVTWTRAQDLACGPTGPAMEVEVTAETDETGRILAWDWSATGEGHVCRPGLVPGIALLAHSEIEGGSPMPASTDPDPALGGGIARNARPLYDVPVRQLQSALAPTGLRTSAIRSLGAFLNVVATEALMEDIARAHGIDGVQVRLAHLSDARGIEVLHRAVELSGDRLATDSTGRGIGLARYKGSGAWCACVADVECIDRVRVNRLVVVADVGEVVSADGVRHQLEGGAIQSLSWALHERAPIGPSGVDAVGWADYPIARFSDVPPIVTDVIDRPGEPFLGAGEAAAGPVAAAIANAVSDALGVRMSSLPLTAESIARALR